MSAHLPTMPPRPSGDITITATHREVMRRLDQGESLTEEHVDTLGALYLHELVDDIVVDHVARPALTPLGRRVLDVGGVLTTRQERPRLVSRPMPDAFICDEGSYVHWVGGRVRSSGVKNAAAATLLAPNGRAELRTMARDLIALIDWLDHEERVRAQDGGS